MVASTMRKTIPRDIAIDTRMTSGAGKNPKINKKLICLFVESLMLLTSDGRRYAWYIEIKQAPKESIGRCT